MAKLSPKHHFKWYGTLKCLDCGQFIANKDLIKGQARHQMVTPDAYGTSETWETLCPKCLKKEGKVLENASSAKSSN